MPTAISQARSTPDVWAVAYVSKASARDIRNFFVNRIGLKGDALKSDLHVTVYYARRSLPSLPNREERIDIEIDPVNLRFMVMAPGGENPRPDIDVSSHEIGVRIKRTAPERSRIEELRARLYTYETPELLGDRRASDHRRNAFGARHFQPHITLLKKGIRDQPHPFRRWRRVSRVNLAYSP